MHLFMQVNNMINKVKEQVSEEYIKKEDLFNRFLTFLIVIYVGNTILKEIEKQIPKELRIDYKKIITEALIFGVVLGGISYIILSLLI